jgi:hypothetical protein
MGDFELDTTGGRYWSEEEDDRQQLNQDVREARDRSPLRSSVRSRIRAPEPSENLASQISKAIDEKLDGFLTKFSMGTLGGLQGKSPSISSQLEELKLSQKELLRQQKANGMNTEGGRFQFLALSKVRGKVESAELILRAAEKDPESFTVTALKSVLSEIEEAKKCIDKRMVLVARADALPNGFRVLSAFEKKVLDSQANSDPEQEKLWLETMKQVEKDQKERTNKAKKQPFDRNHGKGSVGKFYCNTNPKKFFLCFSLCTLDLPSFICLNEDFYLIERETRVFC